MKIQSFGGAHRRAAMRAGLLAVAAMSGIQAAPNSQAALKRQLHEQAKAMLRDPESARFSEEHLRRSDAPPAISLCGVVNAKNAYGGYVGAGRFVSTSTGLVMFESSESGFYAIWDTWCSLPA